MEIPVAYQPHRHQIPVYVTNDEELLRFKLCFGIGRAICQRDDSNFVRELFFGDLPTDDAPEPQAVQTLFDE